MYGMNGGIALAKSLRDAQKADAGDLGAEPHCTSHIAHCIMDIRLVWGPRLAFQG